MLDTDPGRIHAAAVADTLPITTMDEILRRRQERQSPAPVSNDEASLWPVLPSEIVEDTLSDLDVSPKLFSLVAA